MRPLRVEVEGFGSFRDRAVLDLTDADLFVLTGPTGAGKSTLVDAICFALYGSVPRYGDQRLVAPVISQGRVEARVALDFTARGETFRAVRVVRRTKSGATTKEARLERLATGGVVAGNADDMSAQVARLLGLSFEHFVTCVVLPQGRFQQFLHAKPADRGDLLVALLDLSVYGRLARRAHERARDGDARADVLQARLDGELAEATEAARAQAAERHAQVVTLRDQLVDDARELDRILADGRARAAEALDARAAADTLAAIVSPSELADLDRRRHDLDAAVSAADKDRQQAGAAVHAAEDAVAALPPREHLVAAQRLAGDAGAIWREHGQASRDRDQAVAAAAGEQARVTTAEAAVATARAQLEAAQREEQAQALAAGLGPGDDCPVCHRPLAAAPEHDAAPLTAATRATLATAEADLSRARDAATTASGRVNLLAARCDQLRTSWVDGGRSLAQTCVAAGLRLADLTGDVATWPPLADRGDGPAAGSATDADTPAGVPTQPAWLDRLQSGVAQRLEAATNAADGLTAARQAERQAAANLDTARSARATLDGEVEAAWRLYDAAWERARPHQPPQPRRDDPAAAFAELAAWAAATAPARRQTADTAERAAAEARTHWRDRRDAVRRRCAERGVDLGDLPDGLDGAAILEALAAQVERARAARQRIDDALATAASVRDELAAAQRAAAVAHTLHQHLGAKRFETWLLARALRRLAAGATAILRDLSGGAYSLALGDDNAFVVIDHRNADEPRPIRTLSGGETFLASLALALALAEDVMAFATHGAARLEALILDEGFGTLDADTLDAVTTAIEELGARGRMVGLITHVRDLADRIPVRFHVAKVGASSQVRREDAADTTEVAA